MRIEDASRGLPAIARRAVERSIVVGVALAMGGCCPPCCRRPTPPPVSACLPGEVPVPQGYVEHERHTYAIGDVVQVLPGPEWHYHVTVRGCPWLRDRCLGHVNGRGLCAGTMDPDGNCTQAAELIDRSTMLVPTFGELAVLGRFDQGNYFVLGKPRQHPPASGLVDELPPRASPAWLSFAVNGVPTGAPGITASYEVEIVVYRQACVVDTLDFFLSGHLDRGLDGTHPQSQRVDMTARTAQYVKWDRRAFEIFRWDTEYLYLLEDHPGTALECVSSVEEAAGHKRPYIFEPGRWLRRYMAVGERIDGSANMMRELDWCDCNSGLPERPFAYTIELEAHDPHYMMGGDLGEQDVIIVKYVYFGAFERFYYSREWGWVKWELYHPNGTLQSRPDGSPAVSVFNEITDLVQSPENICRTDL